MILARNREYTKRNKEKVLAQKRDYNKIHYHNEQAKDLVRKE